MEFKVLDNHQSIAHQAARVIADAICEKKGRGEPFVLGLATGATMEPLYAELIRLHKDEGLDFSNVKFFNLDNYVGLPEGDRNSYDTQLQQFFLSKINASQDNIDLVSSSASFNHQAYEERIKQAGGIDIQLLGIGRTGHIGFNEVGSSIDCPSRVIELSHETRVDNGKYFNKIDPLTNRSENIPFKAHTRGIAPILEARKIICMANGHGKAEAIKKMVQEGSVEELPVRALKSHENVLMLADEEALSLLSEHELQTHLSLEEKTREKLLTRNQFISVTLDIDHDAHTLLLPPQFDFCDPVTKVGIDEPFDPRLETHRQALASCLSRAQQISVGAHPDDAEIMAGPMMLKATPENPWLTLILTNGAASSNTLNGEFASKTPEELTRMRQDEQKTASLEAGVPLIMCKYPTPAITGDMGDEMLAKVRETMSSLFSCMKGLQTVYGHHPFDKHDTHVITFARQLEALRSLSDEQLNKIDVKGMEVWGDLEVCESRLLKYQIESQEDLIHWRSLIAHYQSQIAGQGRDYSLATIERAQGHAGYQTHPHGANPADGLILAVELTDLVRNKTLSMMEMIRTLALELFSHQLKRGEQLFEKKGMNTNSQTPSMQTMLPFSLFANEQSSHLPEAKVRVTTGVQTEPIGRPH